jgi:hypothetical protein
MLRVFSWQAGLDRKQFSASPSVAGGDCPMLWRLRDFTRKLRAGADAAIRSEYLLRRIHQTQLMAAIAETPRFKDPLRLLASGFKVFSQNQEDGMIAEVFRRIGTTSKRLIEFGIEDGLECNSTFLLMQGWTGTWIEGSQECAERARKAFESYPVEVLNQYVTAANAEELIAKLTGTTELDLLSIDTDTIANERRPRRAWTGKRLLPRRLLAGRRQCAFFVREDLVGDKFCAPFTAENHYEPPRYDLAGSFGHRSGHGPLGRCLGRIEHR